MAKRKTKKPKKTRKAKKVKKNQKLIKPKKPIGDDIFSSLIVWGCVGFFCAMIAHQFNFTKWMFLPFPLVGPFILFMRYRRFTKLYELQEKDK